MNATERFFLPDIQATPDCRLRIAACTVEAENFESIHNHSAYALITRAKRAPE